MTAVALRSSSAAPASTMGPIRQTYATAETFPPVARAYTQVSQVAKELGLLRRAPVFYSLVGAALVLALAGCIAGFVLLGHSWFQLLIAAALGVVLTQVAFLAHEAAHRQILSSGRANDRLARILAAGVVGISYAWWDSKHSRHHANPNRVGKDPDIEVDTVSFLTEDAAQARGIRRLITRRQGWLFFPLLTLEGLNLNALGLRHLFSRQPVKGRGVELALIGARFAIVAGALFVFLPVGMAFAFLGGWWATALLGGLNYQVEHHLFPSMARPHLSKVRVVVHEFCETHDVPYTETSLWRSYAIVIDYLNRVGLAARDPFDCPMVGQYRRA